VDHSGRVDLSLGIDSASILFVPPRGRIGEFHAQISPEQARAVAEEALQFATLCREEYGPFLPDTPMIAVEISQGQDTVNWSGPTVASPGAGVGFPTLIRKAAEAALAHPVRTLVVTPPRMAAHIGRGQRADVEFEISVTADEPVSLMDPIAPPFEGYESLYLMGRRTDKTELEMGAEDHRREWLSPENLVAADTKAIAQEGFWRFTAGGTVALHFNIPIDWVPGPYEIRVWFNSPSGLGETMSGSVTSPPASLMVR